MIVIKEVSLSRFSQQSYFLLQNQYTEYHHRHPLHPCPHLYHSKDMYEKIYIYITQYRDSTGRMKN